MRCFRSSVSGEMGAVMSRFWNDKTKLIKPYVPGEQPPPGSRLIKINTNENPYPPSPRVIEAIMRELGGIDSGCPGGTGSGNLLKLYPNADAAAVVEAACERFGLEPGQVFAANGSDELLAFSFMAFWDQNRPVMAPEISYSFYPVYADLFNVPLIKIPMRNGIEIDCDAFVSGKGGVVIANPNAPTSIGLPLAQVRRILEAHPDDVVLVDEAYVDFGGESAIGLIPEYPNLLVVRTLSKSYCLAGMRVGFAAGSAGLIEGLNRVKNSFNSYTLDRLAIAAGAAAIEDRGYYDNVTKKVIETRERTAASLRKLGFHMPESSANFLFVTHPRYSASEIFSFLKAKGILVRYFNTPGVDNYLRISIGTDEEMDTLVSVLSSYIR